MHAATYRRDLGNGLLLRWSTTHDTEKISQLVGHVFRDKEDDPPNTLLADDVHLLMRGDYPVMGPGDYAVVEDTSQEEKPIVACTCLWRHEWEYEGIPFHIGRPEIVATDPTYRNRGFIRALFAMIHARSEAEGHLAQAITGIPHFYRQFGYEYALDLGGKRITYLALIPELKADQNESFTLRTAQVTDISFIQATYRRQYADGIVHMKWPEYYWRYEIERWLTQPEKGRTSHIQIIVDTLGASRGYIILSPKRRRRGLEVRDLAVDHGVNVQTIMPPILRALYQYGLQMPTTRPDVGPFSQINFSLGRTHPVYEVLGKTLAPSEEPPYAWYIRVKDLPAFLQHIAPALERRLAQSVLAGYSGELKIDFYRGGLHMVFEKGRLAGVEDWRAPLYGDDAGAGFAPLVFLQLMFGYRSLDDLRYAFPDVWADNDTEVVLKTLFPTRPSFVPGF